MAEGDRGMIALPRAMARGRFPVVQAAPVGVLTSTFFMDE